ncbi:MAG: hypothetical protein JSV41_11275 [Gemmatimonadota bacterium]|nr:MAG: hypothetical protein JSV41_11275 [Gemmatimonadota bacterium]
MPRRPTLEGVILIAAVVAEVAVLLAVEDRMARVSLGLLLLAPIVWASARVGVLELVTQSPAERVHKRRFVRLRSQVQQLLDEIRRLNWMAVDAERGFRSREKALQEMDRIEERLKELIADIRSTAGQISPADEEVEGEGEEAVAT